MSVYIGTVLAGLVMGLAVAILLSAPILERLSGRVDTLVRGAPVDRSRGLAWELSQAFRGALYFLAAAPGVLLLNLVPLVGPPLALLVGLVRAGLPADRRRAGAARAGLRGAAGLAPTTGRPRASASGWRGW